MTDYNKQDFDLMKLRAINALLNLKIDALKEDYIYLDNYFKIEIRQDTRENFLKCVGRKREVKTDKVKEIKKYSKLILKRMKGGL